MALCTILGTTTVRPHRCPKCHPRSYVRLVQHLIEKCLLFRMNRDDCVKALAKHARIQPSITVTVWKELSKENPSFFKAYLDNISQKMEKQVESGCSLMI
ncbi:uncharacterized protein LOC105420425 [Amborella trichopoda]|uniref:uncharacterized protein LOC105420425 n=1 Tax=Amborella trichopoda TaxID=13333 RepID=UPI0005D327DF|nr:uncharacterized protein LOC105420425 [Amborella trichopoda]|eukprot:XP_011622263.1 uncharacterized protein LOC105420425 [Amborella trichopoda]